MKRRAYIAGNWKMHKNLSEARVLAEEISAGLPPGSESKVGLFPNAIALAAVVEAVKAAPGNTTGSSSRQAIVGAQNIHWEEKGAFTGEVSADMVLSTGATAVILGHSERRHVFGEDDEAVGKKVVQALQSGLEPILCVGELLEQRESGETEKVVARQLAAGIEAVPSADALARVVIAYEPVWAIGTGKTATPSQGQQVHSFVRAELRKAFQAKGGSGNEADETLILYGGSVKPENAGELLAEEDIDGLLVGGASLDTESFLSICGAAS